MSNTSGTLVTMVGPSGLAQQLDMANYAFAGAGTHVLNFDKLGVSITLTASAAQTAANLVPGPCGQDKFRIRQGDYRILYAIHDDEGSIVIVKTGHRREVYR